MRKIILAMAVIAGLSTAGMQMHRLQVLITKLLTGDLKVACQYRSKTNQHESKR